MLRPVFVIFYNDKDGVLMFNSISLGVVVLVGIKLKYNLDRLFYIQGVPKKRWISVLGSI